MVAGARFNLLLGEFDDQQLVLRLRTAGRQWLSMENSYLAPNFDGDSIWNVFASRRVPRRARRVRAGDRPRDQDVRARVRALLHGVGRVRRAAAWGRCGGAGAASSAATATGTTGTAGGSWASTCSARAPVHRKLELEGRLTGYHWRSDQPVAATASNGGVVFGAQAGGRYRLGEGMRLHLLGEDNVSTYYLSQFRVLAVLELEASL